MSSLLGFMLLAWGLKLMKARILSQLLEALKNILLRSVFTIVFYDRTEAIAKIELSTVFYSKQGSLKSRAFSVE